MVSSIRRLGSEDEEKQLGLPVGMLNDRDKARGPCCVIGEAQQMRDGRSLTYRGRVVDSRTRGDICSCVRACSCVRDIH